MFTRNKKIQLSPQQWKQQQQLIRSLSLPLPPGPGIAGEVRSSKATDDDDATLKRLTNLRYYPPPTPVQITRRKNKDSLLARYDASLGPENTRPFLFLLSAPSKACRESQAPRKHGPEETNKSLPDPKHNVCARNPSDLSTQKDRIMRERISRAYILFQVKLIMCGAFFKAPLFERIVADTLYSLKKSSDGFFCKL